MKHTLSFISILLLVCMLTVVLSACDFLPFLKEKDTDGTTATTTQSTVTTTCSGTTAPGGTSGTPSPSTPSAPTEPQAPTSTTAPVTTTAPITTTDLDNKVPIGDLFPQG